MWQEWRTKNLGGIYWKKPCKHSPECTAEFTRKQNKSLKRDKLKNKLLKSMLVNEARRNCR